MEFGEVLSPQELAKKVEELKLQGKKVVHTSGVFDVLHPGHLSYIKDARSLGDILIMSLNSDVSTKRNKGPNRPYNNQEDRARMLAGLKWVDYVTWFDEDTPIEVLDILKPSIHVKGGDYIPDAMPETETVRKNGGEVVIIPLVGDYSTTRFINRVLAANETEDTFQRPDHVTTRS